ncbi:hypothetical protein BABINDRAFT_103834 [Babjeviella inositovora NRRL Y-12698]|uniref:Uncharacterized protein n=1 Tax=Babjeviella inositovora NRRL Y-12698 TaxID=984486 RepID=A0A1E3QII0_9ASCO|nr:uncharacterized protein BABINDRAFT_103834 [Babjeviella inositovora NRRL Y-12698]ODQ77244.1 hypothetical protein BABINDRAFT_103834 [Babjeviella inositovora NRRL Y-12698]
MKTVEPKIALPSMSESDPNPFDRLLGKVNPSSNGGTFAQPSLLGWLSRLRYGIEKASINLQIGC